MRLLVLGAAFFLTVLAPTAMLVMVGGRTGIIRAQDPWVVQTQADARRLLSAQSPLTPPLPDRPIGREAVSSSFRLDPPAEIRPGRPLVPTAVPVAAALGQMFGARDPRWLTLAALSILGLVVAVAATTGGTSGPLLGLALTLPPLALGTTLGSPWAFSLAALTISWALLRQDRPVAAGVCAGVAAACDPLAVFPALAIVLAGPAEAGPRWDPEPQVSPWKRLLPALGAYAALVLPVALLDLRSFAERVVSSHAIGPGLGVFNLLAYRGLESTVLASLLAAVAPVAAAVSTLAFARPAIPAAVRAGLAALAALVLAPAVMPDAVAVPIVLLGLAAADPQRQV